MKISTFVKRALNSDIQYLKEFNDVTSKNLDRLLQDNSVSAPEVYKQDLPKLIQDVIANHSKAFVFIKDGIVEEQLLRIVNTVVEEEYALQVSKYK